MARLYLPPRDYDQVTSKRPKWSGVGKPCFVRHREPRHGGAKAQRNFVKDAQRREHRAVRRDPRKPCRPQFVAQGRWRLEFDVVAPWSSGQALGELAELRKLTEAIQSPLVDVGAEVNPAWFKHPDDLPVTLRVIVRGEISKSLDRVDEIDRQVGCGQLQY